MENKRTAVPFNIHSTSTHQSKERLQRMPVFRRTATERIISEISRKTVH